MHPSGQSNESHSKSNKSIYTHALKLKNYIYIYTRSSTLMHIYTRSLFREWQIPSQQRK